MILERLFEACASLPLAIVIVVGLIVMLATGAWVEANAGSAAAQAHVYQSPLFLILLTLLAVNVMAAAVIRFPWSRGQIGFVITHIGIELLLAGALIGAREGIDGEVHLAKGESTEVLQLQPECLLVSQLSGDGKPIGYAIPLKLWKATDWHGRWPSGLTLPLRSPALRSTGETTFEVTDWSDARAISLSINVASEHFQQSLSPGAGATIATSRGPLRLAYAHEEGDLPFQLAMANLEKLPSLPGQTVGYVADVVVTEGAGAIERGAVRVNEPATFDGFNVYIGAVDASDPENPRVTLNVRTDPGRPLKVIGSGLIVLGTVSLFASRSARRRVRRPRVIEEQTTPLDSMAALAGVG